jgi:XTP/dITP diphosphohydrolase
MIPRLVIASRNDDKVSEIESVLTHAGVADSVVRGLDWPEVEETGATLEENALLKARVVADVTGLPALGDDTGLEVAALGGRPGVRTARYAGESATYEDNYRKLLLEMSGIESREACFRTVVALVFPDGTEIVASGQVDGLIADEPRGSFGFGYDPVFEVAGKTLGEIPEEEKNKMSHRARALRSLLTELGL